MNRLALSVEYDGTSYCGWQIQPHAPSIQQSLNEAISRVADEPVHCVGAGRTDTGVHASGQVVHFDSVAERSPRSWLLGINSNLPADINLLNVWPVDDAFHARFSAFRRAYRYVILNRPMRSALARDRAWWVRSSLDIERMAHAAGLLLGEHDFSSFRAAACQAHSAVRDLQRLTVEKTGDRISIECEANAFLHHMVRNIVGSLVRVGSGEADADWLADLLQRRDRRLAGMTAPACGLTLTRIDYPPPFEFIRPAPMQMTGE
ncbi:MAG: tRNA pseudouridine(38-40) synthase TruA [Gammaproteobacteria bacterium]